MTLRFTRHGKLHDTGLCEPQLNCLAHAQCIELDIGSECGGHGVCGGDRIRLPEGSGNSFSPVTAVERRHLTAEEIAQGWRLGCQCWPESAMLETVIEAPRGD